MDTGEQH
jgi:hypothetical protein